MFEQENIKVVQANFDALNAHDLEAFNQLRTEDCLVESPIASAPLNWEQNQRSIQAYLTAFPDLHLDVTLLIAQGNYVVAHWTATVTQTGPLPTPTGRSIPATGKQMVLKGSDTYELQGGNIVRVLDFGDLASLLGQLGVLPPVAGPAHHHQTRW